MAGDAPLMTYYQAITEIMDVLHVTREEAVRLSYAFMCAHRDAPPSKRY